MKLLRPPKKPPKHTPRDGWQIFRELMDDSSEEISRAMLGCDASEDPADAEIFETVMVGGELRVVGAALSAEEAEALERAYDAGDVRAEATLKLLREGRPVRRAR